MKSHDHTRRPEVVVYHSAYGLRPAIIEFADKLRAEGHIVHTPDLYDGEVFGDRNDAMRKIQELGFDKLLDRAQAPWRRCHAISSTLVFQTAALVRNSWRRRAVEREEQS